MNELQLCIKKWHISDYNGDNDDDGADDDDDGGDGDDDVDKTLIP